MISKPLTGKQRPPGSTRKSYRVKREIDPWPEVLRQLADVAAPNAAPNATDSAHSANSAVLRRTSPAE